MYMNTCNIVNSWLLVSRAHTGLRSAIIQSTLYHTPSLRQCVAHSPAAHRFTCTHVNIMDIMCPSTSPSSPFPPKIYCRAKCHHTCIVVMQFCYDLAFSMTVPDRLGPLDRRHISSPQHGKLSGHVEQDWLSQGANTFMTAAQHVYTAVNIHKHVYRSGLNLKCGALEFVPKYCGNICAKILWPY